MKYVLKSQLSPLVLEVRGSEEDISFFKDILADSSDMAAYCLTLSERAEEEIYVDPVYYRVCGMNIFEWRKAYREVNAKLEAFRRSYERLVEENRTLTLQLVEALNAKTSLFRFA
mgnify:CR=1 FL=1